MTTRTAGPSCNGKKKRVFKESRFSFETTNQGLGALCLSPHDNRDGRKDQLSIFHNDMTPTRDRGRAGILPPRRLEQIATRDGKRI